MKSYAIAAFAGATAAAWAPPGYGGGSSSDAAATLGTPAEGYSQPPVYTQPVEETSSGPAPPVFGVPTSSDPVPSESHAAPGGYGPSSSPSFSISVVFAPSASAGLGGPGTTSTRASAPKPSGGYAWGNGTEGGHGGTGGDISITQIVTSYETYCPGPTKVTQNGQIYTITSATTLTITDCPCTVAKPIDSYVPDTTTEVVASFTTVCPEPTTLAFPHTNYTISSSTTLTVTGCPAPGCTVTKTLPGTFIVPTLTSTFEKPEQPTTITIGGSAYPVTDATTIYAIAPTSYATAVYTKPKTPTTVTIDSSAIPISEATTITYATPGGYTVTAALTDVYPTSAASPASPVGGEAAPGFAPSANGTSLAIPQQTGNGAEKLVAGGAAVAAVIGAFLL